MGSLFLIGSRAAALFAVLGAVCASAARAGDGQSPRRPVIQSVDANGTTLLISGIDFGTAATPVVTLGGRGSR